MEVMKAAEELRNLLISHDRTVHIIASIDNYINQKRRQVLYLDLDLYQSSTVHRISVATGVKKMYEHYRVSRIQKVQKLSQFIIATLSPDQAAGNQTTMDTTDVPITMDMASSQYTKDSTVWCRHD